jgi:hypothetical protein
MVGSICHLLLRLVWFSLNLNLYFSCLCGHAYGCETMFALLCYLSYVRLSMYVSYFSCKYIYMSLGMELVLYD